MAVFPGRYLAITDWRRRDIDIVGPCAKGVFFFSVWIGVGQSLTYLRTCGGADLQRHVALLLMIICLGVHRNRLLG